MYHPEYRLPMTSVAARAGLDPRRAELTLDVLIQLGVLGEEDAMEPQRADWGDLARVHSAAWLEAITQPETLARIFAVEPWDVPSDAVLDSLRRATGGTVLAARIALANPGAVLNLFGGFHHARPDAGGGFCAINDIAVAVAQLRAEGFTAPVAILDLDAHAPDGLAACFAPASSSGPAPIPGPPTWIGSITGHAWSAPPHIDESLLPPGSGDDIYLRTLSSLLDRMPRAALTFVIAGGDVRAGDALGALALTEAGVRQRDQRVHDALAGAAAVWLPGGGYRHDAWRVLAGTALVLAGHGGLELRADADPLRSRFRRVSLRLGPDLDDLSLDASDLDEVLGPRRAEAPRFLGAYTRAAIELALDRFGMLDPVRRLGYHELRVELDRAALGDRFRLWALGGETEAEHLLAESVLARDTLGDEAVLFIHWLTLRHPLGAFRSGKPPLPGQDAPGLGLAREAGELHRRIAERLGLAGVVMRPAWLHVAVTAKERMHFHDPAVQGRMEALLRDTHGVPLTRVSQLAHDGKLTLNGEPWRWEPAPMVEWVKPRPRDRHREAEVAAASHFAVSAET